MQVHLILRFLYYLRSLLVKGNIVAARIHEHLQENTLHYHVLIGT